MYARPSLLLSVILIPGLLNVRKIEEKDRERHVSQLMAINSKHFEHILTQPMDQSSTFTNFQNLRISFSVFYLSRFFSKAIPC